MKSCISEPAESHITVSEPDFENVWRLIRAVATGAAPMRSSEIARLVRVPVGIVWECLSRHDEAEMVLDDGAQRWRIA
jgi:hypothetical protein